MTRLNQKEDPPRPSKRLASEVTLNERATVRRTEPRRPVSRLRGDLDWAVMKGQEKQRRRRYETANGLARAIQRCLADEVVEARPPNTRFRLGKFLRRRGRNPPASLGPPSSRSFSTSLPPSIRRIGAGKPSLLACPGSHSCCMVSPLS